MDTVRTARGLADVLQPLARTPETPGTLGSAAAVFYQAPLSQWPAFTFDRIEPTTLLGGRLHREAIAATRAALKAPPAQAEAELAGYFARGTKASSAKRITRKLHHLIHFANKQGPAERRRMELLLAPHMPHAMLSYVVSELKHRLFKQCSAGEWSQETLAEADHLLHLRAARPEHVGPRERAETQALRGLVDLRVRKDLPAFYDKLLALAKDHGSDVQGALLFSTLQRDSQQQALLPQVDAVIVKLARPERDAMLERCFTAEATALAQRFFGGATRQQERAIGVLLRARSRTLLGAIGGLCAREHPYEQLKAQLNGAKGRLRWQLIELLAGFVRYDLSHSVMTQEEVVRRVSSIRDPEVRLSLLDVAGERRCAALVMALVGEGANGLKLDAAVRDRLPGAIMATRRAPLYVTLGDRYDQVTLGPPSHADTFDLAYRRGTYGLTEETFPAAVRDLGREGGAMHPSEPVAHHSRVTEAGVEHTLLRRLSPRIAGRAHATLRCHDAAQALALLHSGNWEAKTLSGTNTGETLVAALHSELQVEQKVVELPPKKLEATLRKEGSQGWQRPSGYVLPDGRHRVLLTRSKSAHPQVKPRSLLAQLARSATLTAPRRAGSPAAAPLPVYRDETAYANDDRFVDGTSVAHIPPEDFVTLGSGAKPYAFHVLDLVGAIVSKAKGLSDAGSDLTGAWSNPLTRAPLSAQEIEQLRAHRHGWALRDVPLPVLPSSPEPS